MEISRWTHAHAAAYLFGIGQQAAAEKLLKASYYESEEASSCIGLYKGLEPDEPEPG